MYDMKMSLWFKSCLIHHSLVFQSATTSSDEFECFVKIIKLWQNRTIPIFNLFRHSWPLIIVRNCSSSAILALVRIPLNCQEIELLINHCCRRWSNPYFRESGTNTAITIGWRILGGWYVQSSSGDLLPTIHNPRGFSSTYCSRGLCFIAKKGHRYLFTIIRWSRQNRP